MLILTSSPKSYKNKITKIKTPSTNKETKLNKINFTSSTKSPISPINLGSSEKKIQKDNIIINKKNSKNSNKNQFLKIKKLIEEFENEKNGKERLYPFKTETKNSKSQHLKSKKFFSQHIPSSKKISLIPNKKIYYNVPKIKSQMQFNRYLINDFKENDSELDYIKRSLKYQKINEDFDELIFLKQIKEAAKNGIAESVVDESKKNDMDFFYSPESERSNHTVKKLKSKNVSEFNMDNKLRNNNLYSPNLKRFYTEKIKQIPQNLSTTPNRRISINSINNNRPHFNSNNQLNLYNNFVTKTKGNEKENLKKKIKILIIINLREINFRWNQKIKIMN